VELGLTTGVVVSVGDAGEVDCVGECEGEREGDEAP